MESPASYVNAEKSSDDGTSNPNRCFQAGKDDGRNSGFSRSEFDNCGSSYEHGFMKASVTFVISVTANYIEIYSGSVTT